MLLDVIFIHNFKILNFRIMAVARSIQNDRHFNVVILREHDLNKEIVTK